MLLLAVIVGTLPWITYILIAILLIEGVVLLVCLEQPTANKNAPHSN
jgi:hypothetical protein